MTHATYRATVRNRSIRTSRVVYWALAIALIMLYLAWPMSHLWAYSWSYDEGVYMQQAALANAGFRLYSEVLLNKPPLLVWILQGSFLLFGQRLEVARLAALGLSLIGFVALGAVARQLWGRWGGLLAAVSLLGLPGVPVRAHAVMGDLPAAAMATMAIGAAIQFRRHGQRKWLAFSGCAFGGALLIHPILIHAIVPTLLVLLVPRLELVRGRVDRAANWADLAVFASGVAGVGLAALAVVDRSAFVRWVLLTNITSLGTEVTFRGTGAQQILEYLGKRWTLVVLSLAGTGVLLASRRTRDGLIVPAGWTLGAVVMLSVWEPVWNHYMLFVALPLTIVAGGGIKVAASWGTEAVRGRGRPVWWRMALGGLTFLSFVAFGLHRGGAEMPQPEGGPEWTPERVAALAYLEEATSPDGPILTDDPLLAFAAGRLVPPANTEASYKSIRLGHLTVSDLIESTLSSGARAALFATGRLEIVPGLEDWVATMASERRDFGEMRAYRLDGWPAPDHSVDERLGESIRLIGYSLSPSDLKAGTTVTVTLFWLAQGAVRDDYTVFVHLLGEGNALIGQHDGPPLMGRYRTSQWIENVVIPDRHSVAIDGAAPAGQADLVVGMYRRPSLQRLAAHSADGRRWPDDVILLGRVDIRRP